MIIEGSYSHETLLGGPVSEGDQRGVAVVTAGGHTGGLLIAVHVNNDLRKINTRILLI